VGGEDEVGGGDDAGELDASAGRLGELPLPDGLGEDGADDQSRASRHAQRHMARRSLAFRDSRETRSTASEAAPSASPSCPRPAQPDKP
jgi:hypothetical protein